MPLSIVFLKDALLQHIATALKILFQDRPPKQIGITFYFFLELYAIAFVQARILYNC